MKLKTKLFLMSNLPLLGLCLAVLSSFLVTRKIDHTIAETVNEGSANSELAHDLQTHVIQVQQFLTDVSATRALDGLGDGYKEAEEHRAAFLADLAKFKTVFENRQAKAELEKIATIEKTFNAYYEIGHRMAEAYVKDGPASGNKIMPEFDQGADNLDKSLSPFVESQIHEFKDSLASVQAFAHKTNAGILLVGGGTALATFFFALFSIRLIATQLNRTMGQLTESASHISASTTEISNSSKALAEAASEQAASLEEASASLEEISSMTKRNADNAVNSKNLSQQTSRSVNSGLERLGELSRTLTAIKAAVGDMESAVREMQGSSQEIAKIIKTIDEIAFQTNLLALNAAVEAARAGEAGMGFAVVADEVRALAQRSAQAARDTSDKIEHAIKRSELGGVASAKVVKNLAEVEGNAHNIEQVFNGIVAQIKSLDEVIGEISAASREQSQGVGEVNMAVSQMDKVTQSNASTAEENAGAAEELRSQVGMLQNIVGDLERVVSGTTTANPPMPKPAPPQTRVAKRSASKPTPAENFAAAFDAPPHSRSDVKTSSGSFENF